MKEFRLSAAGIVLQQDKILLVRYKNHDGGTFLVGPGGGVQIEEDFKSALKREVMEEAGIDVIPSKMLFVEDLLSKKYRIIKVWFLCSVAGGQLAQTEEAEVEGIIEAGWYSKDQLANEIVYPKILKTIDWKELLSHKFETKFFDLEKANF